MVKPITDFLQGQLDISDTGVWWSIVNTRRISLLYSRLEMFCVTMLSRQLWLLQKALSRVKQPKRVFADASSLAQTGRSKFIHQDVMNY